MRRVCVYLGSNMGAGPEFCAATQALGVEIARRGLELVYGGSGVGLMGVLATSVIGAGGNAIGVIPRALAEKKLGHPDLVQEIVVADMHERKARMIELADGFIALPGGLGTLEELFEVLTWAQLGFHEKPCGLLDVNGYYAELNAFLDKVADMGFVKRVHRELALVDDNPARLLDRFERFVPPRVSKWIDGPEDAAAKPQKDEA
ncbi:MAG: TIGR00730 family Rossman fold protein [Desulfovibrionaceae bacterium]